MTSLLREVGGGDMVLVPLDSRDFLSRQPPNKRISRTPDARSTQIAPVKRIANQGEA